MVVSKAKGEEKESQKERKEVESPRVKESARIFVEKDQERSLLCVWEL